MTPLISPCRSVAGLFSLLVFASPSARAADASTSDNAAALLAVTPRTNLPPAADDPTRPPNLRPVSRSDGQKIGSDSWIEEPTHRSYTRSSFGTWSNFDEAKGNPFPVLPNPLILKNGQPVKDADTWWKQRRPEILSDFLNEIYGKIPESTPKVSWEVTSVDEVRGIRMKIIVGHIDNSAYPEATPSISLTLYVPSNASGPVPVMVCIGNDPRERGELVNSGVDGTKPERYTGPPAFGSRMEGILVDEQARREALQLIMARGWGYAFFNAGSVQPDSSRIPPNHPQGIIELVNKGRPRSPDEWGDISAWAWGVNRTIDYLETDKDVDAKELGVQGHSRWGKTALWAAALDQRWAIVYASCSGEGGAKLHRRNYGETVDNFVDRFPGWMAGNFQKYGGHWNDLPVDAHELIALVAPRPAFITGGTGDFTADPHGEFLAAVAAGPVYRLLGKNDLGTTKMPAPNVALISGDLAFRNRAGGQSDWPVFLEYASKYLKAPAAQN
jgi:hypothetical protein